MPALLRLRTVLTVIALTAVLLATPMARAQTLLRDAEIEYALKQMMRPLATASGLSASQLRVLVIHDSSLNAFVIDGRTIFIHSGLLLKLENAAQVQAVLSHEMAHIANGHITRRMTNVRGANSSAAMGLALALAVAATGNSQAAAGVALGTSSSAQRVLFSHTRAEESSADQAGIRYMTGAGINPQAMVDVLEIFRGQEALSAQRRDPYALTHPLSAQRIRSLKGYAAAYADKSKANPTADYWFGRAKGKLAAFLRKPSYTLRKVGKKDKSEAAMLSRAIAYHRKPDTKAALTEMNALIAKRPNDAYYQELKGQILLESRQFRAAVAAYGKAVNMAPKEPLILAGYGRALLALKTRDGDRKALTALEKARSRDPHDPRMLRDLAVAYARAKQPGMAALAAAERYAVTGRLADAAAPAKRAADLLPRGSPGWLRAQDVLRAAEAAKKSKRRKR